MFCPLAGPVGLNRISLCPYDIRVYRKARPTGGYCLRFFQLGVYFQMNFRSGRCVPSIGRIECTGISKSKRRLSCASHVDAVPAKPVAVRSKIMCAAAAKSLPPNAAANPKNAANSRDLTVPAGNELKQHSPCTGAMLMRG